MPSAPRPFFDRVPVSDSAPRRASSSGEGNVLPGEHVAGRYRVQRVVGAGGMGVVVAAFDEKEQRDVAIKLLLPRRVDENGVQRFFREARSTQRIQSSHVVRIFEVGLDEERPFIVMERLDGQDLAARLKTGGPLSLREAADCLLQACEALAHAHGAGIVHRDIKPSNLFQQLRADGCFRVKVLDFGISKSLAREEWESTLTTSGDGSLLGSPPYMSPEQVRNARTVDHRSDFWSLGVVAYRLLSGQHPYDGESVGEIFARILERRFVPLRARGIDVPPQVDAIIARCLSHERTGRYSTAAELAMAWAPFASEQLRPLADRICETVRKTPPAFPMNDTSGASLPDSGDATVLDPTPPHFGIPLATEPSGVSAPLVLASDVVDFRASPVRRMAVMAAAFIIATLAGVILIVSFDRQGTKEPPAAASLPAQSAPLPQVPTAPSDVRGATTAPTAPTAPVRALTTAATPRPGNSGGNGASPGGGRKPPAPGGTRTELQPSPY